MREFSMRILRLVFPSAAVGQQMLRNCNPPVYFVKFEVTVTSALVLNEFSKSVFVCQFSI